MASGNYSITIQASNTAIAAINSINANTISQQTITANGIVGGMIVASKYYTPPEPCGARRGGPASKVFCEVYAEIQHTNHIGRSRTGKWYNWKERDDGFGR